MIIQLHRIEVISRKDMDMIDITPEMDRLVEASGTKQGIVFVTTAHTPSGIVVTEGVECLERESRVLQVIEFHTASACARRTLQWGRVSRTLAALS